MTEHKEEPSGLTQLLEAIEREDLEALTTILTRAPALLSAGGEAGMSPLHIAARDGRARAAGLLLARGAAIEAKDRVHGSTPLGFAAYYGHIALVRGLLEAGADTSFVNPYGLTPLQIAEGGVRGEHIADAPDKTKDDFCAIVALLEEHALQRAPG